MRCLDPRSVGFKDDGKTISWSPRTHNKGYATFQLPCGKCRYCRLEYARQLAVRCVHESKMHSENCFITLTYSDENLKSPRLQYRDFQLFAKKLRRIINQQISIVVTGEYGEKKKRPHWHALIFGWNPPDCKYAYTNHNKDEVYTSKMLDRIWGLNDPEKKPNEVGTVTFKSAGYVARYAAKKLVHGRDQDHDFHPIHHRSKKHAIGKRWLEVHYKDVFNHGYIILDGGKKTSIPRYYEAWFKKNHPEEWLCYIDRVKLPNISRADKQAERDKLEWLDLAYKRFDEKKGGYVNYMPMTRSQIDAIVLDERFNRLQQNLKGDI